MLLVGLVHLLYQQLVLCQSLPGDGDELIERQTMTQIAVFSFENEIAKLIVFGLPLLCRLEREGPRDEPAYGVHLSLC